MTEKYNNYKIIRAKNRLLFYSRNFKVMSVLVVFAVVWTLVAAQTPAKIPPLVLRTEPLPFTPKEFHIASVTDEREDRKAVAYLIPAPATATAPAPTTAQPVDLQGGGLAAIKAFAQQGPNRNTKLRPIAIRLKECKVTETPGAKGRVDGRISVAMAFDYIREGKPVHLVEYKGGARYSRPASSLAVVEPTLRRSLTDALRYINGWMDQEADRNEKLARDIQVHFTDYIRNAEDDTVFYTPERPINWNDFTARPRAGRYAALIFPSFAYERGSEVRNGIIHLNVTMKVYMFRGC